MNCGALSLHRQMSSEEYGSSRSEQVETGNERGADDSKVIGLYVWCVSMCITVSDCRQFFVSSHNHLPLLVVGLDGVS